MLNVTRRGDSAELRERLRDELVTRLAPAGWCLVDGERDDSMTLAGFVCPLSGEFAATVTYLRAFSVPDRPPVRIGQALCGVSYEPLRRLWPLLEDHVRLAALTESVGDMPEWARGCGMEVRTQTEVAVVVGRLARVALEEAIGFAERYTSVDALLEAHRDEESESVDMVVPALLAAAGRFEEARDALARYRPEMNLPEERRRARRFVYQLTRWIDSDGDASLLPSGPPPGRYTDSERRPVGESLREARARNGAVEAVKRAGDGHDRAELRAMLESELAERALAMNPLQVEQAIDQVGISPAERARQGAQALKMLGKVGLTVANAIRTREIPDLPDMSVPEWLEPPARAVYAVPQIRDPGHQWTAVRLEDSSDEWLQRVHAAVPRLLKSVESATFDAWLDCSPEDDGAGPFGVYIGDRRVGWLDEDATAAYSPVMEAAALRDELPCVGARLTPIGAEADYLLEIAIPASRYANRERRATP